MRLRIGIVLVIAASLILISSGLTVAEEDAAVAEQEAGSDNAGQDTVSGVKAGSEIQWLWGEVVSVDPLNNKLIAKYLDYETDSEKEISLIVDDQTVYENIKSLAELKTLNTVSVDYVSGPDGKYIVKNISVEKLEGPPAQAEEGQKQPAATNQPKADQAGKTPAQAEAE